MQEPCPEPRAVVCRCGVAAAVGCDDAAAAFVAAWTESAKRT